MAYSPSQIKDCAEGLPIGAGVSGIFPVPLERIAQHLGYDALAFDGPPEISGAIRYSQKKIFVNQNESPQRQRFTLAHEIGHAVLHSTDGVDTIDYRATMESADNQTLKDPKEREANLFAASLLMPTDEFLEVWRSRGGDMKRIANYFGVSEPSVGFRAKSLKIA